MSVEDRNGDALAALVDLLAEQLAPRVAAELVDRALSERAVNGEPEPWRLLTLKDAAERLGRSERWACTCPARVGRCCHVLAAEAATGRNGSHLRLRLRFSAEEILGLRREVSRRRREEAEAQLVRDRALFADAPFEVPPQ